MRKVRRLARDSSLFLEKLDAMQIFKPNDCSDDSQNFWIEFGVFKSCPLKRQAMRTNRWVRFGFGGFTVLSVKDKCHLGFYFDWLLLKKTSSNGVFRDSAMSIAHSKFGVFFPDSIAEIVWRLTPTFWLSCSWVIFWLSNRNDLILFLRFFSIIYVKPSKGHLVR